MLYTVGNFTIDDIVLWPGGQTWLGQPGGNVLFSAVGARIWLKEVGIVARLGHDYPPERLKEIKARQIALALHAVEAPTLHDWALYEANGARQFINHLNSGTNEQATIRPDEIAAEHLWGEAYHIAPVPITQQVELVARLKRPDRFVSVDPHEGWIVGNETIIETMLANVNFFLPSEIEANKLFGSNDPEAAARAFARFGPRAVVIKLGSDGSLVYDAASDKATFVPAYPARVRDTTGAGDAYCGGFLAGFLLTKNPISAAQYGTVSASFVVEAIGALATEQPSLAQARARLAVIAGSMGYPLT